MAKFVSHPALDPVQSKLIACTRTTPAPVFLYQNKGGQWFLYKPGAGGTTIETITEQEAKMRYAGFQEKQVGYAVAFPDRETLETQRMILKEIEAATMPLSPDSSREDLVKVVKLQTRLLRAMYEHLKAFEINDLV